MSISFTNMPPQDVATLLTRGLIRDLSELITAELHKQVDPILKQVAMDMAQNIKVTCEANYNHLGMKTELLLRFKEEPIQRLP